MSQRSSIEWTGRTWNPIRFRLKQNAIVSVGGGVKSVPAGTWGYHCEKISPGCKNCYAERMNMRTLPAWGTGLGYTVPNTEALECYLDEQELLRPLKWSATGKAGPFVFPCSMTDLFGRWVTDDILDRMFAVMAIARHLTFQVLTKRADRMHAYISGKRGHFTAEYAQNPTRSASAILPIENIWLGVSVENQMYADERIPLLLRTPAAKRWVSYEPALDWVDFLYPSTLFPNGAPMCCSGHECACQGMPVEPPLAFGVDWIVFGLESGTSARPGDIQWARDLIRDTGCPLATWDLFIKQIGAKPYDSSVVDIMGPDQKVRYRRPPGDPMITEAEKTPGYWTRPSELKLRDRKGGKMDEWPDGLKVREIPTSGIGGRS